MPAMVSYVAFAGALLFQLPYRHIFVEQAEANFNFCASSAKNIHAIVDQGGILKIIGRAIFFRKYII